mmetsp:Transcript_29769/g.44157  ORF Transcript_29769/g.44157 Transcript_29769/m.44157 type:complete len:696 (+) Transcript_29769:266-2353(+)
MDLGWFWRADDGSWMPFSDEHGTELEVAFTTGSDCAILTIHGVMYDCDLRSFRQTNLNTSFVRQIHRGWPEPDPRVDVYEVQRADEEEEHDDDDYDDEEEEDEDLQEESSDDDDNDGEEEDELMTNQAPKSFFCPLTMSIMRDPVITSSGSTFERKAIQKWLKKNTKDPLTNASLSSNGSGPPLLIPNRTLRDTIEEWKRDFTTNMDKKLPANADSQMKDENVDKDLQEGQKVQIASESSSATHTIKLLGGVYSCTCASWRFAGGPIDRRTCKHLKSYRGDEAEESRVGQFKRMKMSSASSPSSKTTSLSLQGKTICFTGSLSIVRTLAQSQAVAAGAQVSKSVTRTTNILVAGPGSGMKLSDAQATGVEIWSEEDFTNALSGNSVASSSSAVGNSVSSGANGGPSLGSVNSSIPLKIMLAEKWKDGNDPKGMLMSEKLDGMRAWWDGHKLWSRQGNVIHAPEWWKSSLPNGFALDGELWLGRGQFQQCMSICRRQDGSDDWKKIKYLVFDAPELVDKGYEDRHQIASDRLKSTTGLLSGSTQTTEGSYVEMHPYEICKSSAHLKEELEAVEELSGEGLMLRRSNSKYSNGRSKDLLKVKTASDDEGVVLKFERGKGRHTGRVGALHLQNRDGKKFKVGSGLTDEERENPPPVGSVVTYRYNDLTQGGVPRHPVFVRARPDVEASEIIPGFVADE